MLGDVYLETYNACHVLDDLERAVRLYKDAIQYAADIDPMKVTFLSNFGLSLARRFERYGQLDDINMSCLTFRDVLRLTPYGSRNKCIRLCHLGNALLLRFARLDDPQDINESTMVLEESVLLTPEGDPAKSAHLSSLSISLFRRFERFGIIADISKSILMVEDAVRLTPGDDPARSSYLNNASISYSRRFEWLGDISDINKAISMQDAAVLQTPDNHPDYASRLSNYSYSLFLRFQRLGDVSDINKSISVSEDAINFTPHGHPDRPTHLGHLGSSLFCNYERFNNPTDIERSISLMEEAVQLTPEEHPKKIPYMTSLAMSLFRRFERLDDHSDINKSVSLYEVALSSTPDSHPMKPSYLNGVGRSLLRRFDRFHDREDINQSILTFETAIRLTPDNLPEKTSFLNHLGHSFFLRFQRFGDSGDLKTAIVHYSLAARSTTGSPSSRFQASTSWARCAQHLGSFPLEAYAIAIDLLPQLAWMGLPITDRHYQLLDSSRVVRDAAAAAVKVGQYNTAVEWLDQGRSIIWGQLLQLRSPVDDLRHERPELANRLEQISRDLEGAGTRGSVPDIRGPVTQVLTREVAGWYHELAQEREELVKIIRDLDGYDRFLLPKTLSQLTPAAHGGPVVTLNISETRCDALVLMPGLDDVLPIFLENFTLNDAQDLHKSLRALLKDCGRCIFPGSDRGAKLVPTDGHLIDPEAQLERVLSELWLRLVKPVLDVLSSNFQTPSTDDLSRIWWCPTGPLNFLPIHAAGIYGVNAPFGSKLSDFVVSSYTPTLSALLARSRPFSPPKRQVLAVAQPFASGQTALPGTIEEIDLLKQAVGEMPFLSLMESEATVEHVAQGMESSSWVHFACHGVQNIANPTESALLLADSSRLTLSQIIKLSLPHAELAFLSACQTAAGAEELAEEAVHLAAGMLLAGYRGVIATTWSIVDRDAPHVAGKVYTRLFEESDQPDPTRAAHALHFAVREVRKNQRRSRYSPGFHLYTWEL
ncbi:CHAT domain-containing protein, partial [Gautieria morchelliformis]